MCTEYNKDILQSGIYIKKTKANTGEEITSKNNNSMKRTITTALLILMSLINYVNATALDPDTLISNVVYDYEITSGYSDKGYWTMCKGTLSMTITVPDIVKRIELQRANGQSVKFMYPPFYNVRRDLDISGKSSVEVEVQEVRADTYFRIDCVVDKTHYYSSHFAVNDLISPEDLEKLKETNSTLEVLEEFPEIEIKDNGVYINCQTRCKIEIVSIDGKTISNCFIDTDTEVPLQTGIYFIRILCNNKYITKKLMII